MKIKLLFCLLFFTSFAFGQVQNNVWCFGNHAGLDFNSGTPVALPTTAISTNEGCSSISDNSGQLLFYTDGVSVWNKNHIQMPNGFGLQGNPSTSQSALIVPIQSATGDLYYVFTINELAGAMTYSIVDMGLQSGMGDVTATKNVALHPAVCEKQVAIQKCDKNVWVISHEWGTNNFFADLVTPSGINPSVISSVGTINQGGSGPTWNSVGYMKASQQGNRLALAIRDANLFEVFDFDSNTGFVSNSIPITPNHSSLYGVEFSPNGNILYGSSILSQEIYQFNLLAGSPASISASSTTITTAAWGCALQLATDGKIYIAQPTSFTTGLNYLGVINSPDSYGTSCNFVANGVSLGSNNVLVGLPNFMIRANIPAIPTITQNGLTLTSSSVTGNQWYLNGVAIPGATGQSYNIISNGVYTLSVTNGICSSTTSEGVNMTNLGIDNWSTDNLFSFSPNPTSGIINVSFNLISEKSILIISNIVGETIYCENIQMKGNEIIDLTKYSKGIYFIAFQNRKGTATKKIVIAD